MAQQEQSHDVSKSIWSGWSALITLYLFVDFILRALLLWQSILWIGLPIHPINMFGAGINGVMLGILIYILSIFLKRKRRSRNWLLFYLGMESALVVSLTIAVWLLTKEPSVGWNIWALVLVGPVFIYVLKSKNLREILSVP